MSRRALHIISLVILLLSSTLGFSQMEVSVRANINRDKIMIGEPVELKLEAKVPNGTNAKWFPLDSMTHFEFIDKGKIDTVQGAETRTYRQTLTITSFDSGRWAVPSLPFTIGNKEYLTDSLPVSVAYSNFDPKQDYHDIKEILEVESISTRYVNWIILATGLLSLLAIIYFLRKPAAVTAPVVNRRPLSTLPPLEEALTALAELQRQGYAETTRIKAFHTGLNDILRQYLFRKTGMAAMEKTSGELMLPLKQYNLSVPDFTSLAQVLRMNDAVKFAKFQPSTDENMQAFETIKQSVQKLDGILNNKS